MTGLTPIEERIAGIMGPTAIAGIEEGLDTCMKSERTSRMETKRKFNVSKLHNKK